MSHTEISLKILYTLNVSLITCTCSKLKYVPLYKPISFVLEFHYMSNGLTSKIP